MALSTETKHLLAESKQRAAELAIVDPDELLARAREVFERDL